MPPTRDSQRHYTVLRASGLGALQTCTDHQALNCRLRCEGLPS